MIDLTIPFLGAQLALVVLLWGVYQMVRRPPNIAGRQRTLDEFTDVEMWIKHGLDELQRSLPDLTGLRDRKGKLEQRSRASRGLGVGWAQRVFMLGFLGGTWLLLYESESAIGVILNLTSGFLSLSREQAAFVGPLLAVGAFMITHTAALAAHKPERARRTWRWACSGTLVTLLLVAALWIVFLSGRTVDVTDTVSATAMEGTLTQTLYLLALLNALAAAFAGTGVLLLLEDRFVATEIERVERLMRSLTQHVLYIARELKDNKVTLPDDMQHELDRLAPDVAGPTASGPRKTAPVITVASSLLLLLAAAAEAQPARNAPVPPLTATTEARPTRNAPVVAPSATSQASARRAGACEGLFDVSLSTDTAARLDAVKLFAEHLGRFIDAKDCRLLRGLPFSGDPYSTLLEIEMPAMETAATSCTTTTAARAVDVWFPKLLEARQQREAGRCAEQTRATQAAAVSRRSQTMADASRQIQLFVQNAKPRGTCTALDLAIALAHARSLHVVVITDGYDNCPQKPNTGVAESSADFRWLTMLLIPSRGPTDNRWAELADRIAQLAAKYPGARVRPFNELTATFWTR